jgi:hypothetical protein
MLLPKFPGTLGRKIGYGFFYIGQLIQSLFSKRTAGTNGFLMRQFLNADTAFAS